MCYSCKDSRKSINILGKIPDSIGNLQGLLVQYAKIQLFLYGNQNENTMNSKLIKEIINSREPIAIMKYLEWPIFSNDYALARYTILKVDKRYNDIQEVDIPFNLVPFVISKICCFTEVLRINEGVVWERMGFRELVKRSMSKAKIQQLIHQW